MWVSPGSRAPPTWRSAAGSPTTGPPRSSPAPAQCSSRPANTPTRRTPSRGAGPIRTHRTRPAPQPRWWSLRFRPSLRVHLRLARVDRGGVGGIRSPQLPQHTAVRLVRDHHRDGRLDPLLRQARRPEPLPELVPVRLDLRVRAAPHHDRHSLEVQRLRAATLGLLVQPVDEEVAELAVAGV